MPRKSEVKYLREKLDERDRFINKLILRLMTHTWKDYSHVLGYDESPQRDYRTMSPASEIIPEPTEALDLNSIDRDTLSEVDREALEELEALITDGENLFESQESGLEG